MRWLAIIALLALASTIDLPTSFADERGKEGKCKPTTREVGAADPWCREQRTCLPSRYATQIASCAEAHYRYFVCGHEWLDRNPKNGVPCQNYYGDTSEEMKAKLAREAFKGPVVVVPCASR